MSDHFEPKITTYVDTERGGGQSIPVGDVLPHESVKRLYERTVAEHPNLPAPERSGPLPAVTRYPKDHEFANHFKGPQWFHDDGEPHSDVDTGVRGFTDVPMSKTLPHLTVLQHQGFSHAHQVIQSRIKQLNDAGGVNPVRHPDTGAWLTGSDYTNPSHYTPGVRGWAQALANSTKPQNTNISTTQFK